MGYELNKLMKQYGVSTPGMSPYTGPAGNAAALQAYNQYRTDYQNRVASTPMYGDQQYLTGLANERATPTYSSLISAPIFDASGNVINPSGNNTVIGGGGTDTTKGGGGTDTISTDPNAYKYNYFDNSQQDNALIKQFQSGENPKTRADLVEFYHTQLGRLPDEAGFKHWLSKFGEEIDPTEMKELQTAAQPEIAQRQGLEALYKQYAERDPDIAGLEYWMGEIGRAGGIDPIKERFIAGINKEIDMGNAGYRTFDPNQMGSRMSQAEADMLNARAPFLYGTIPGTISPQYPAGRTNNIAREQLFNLYTQNLGRTMPDQTGFEWWINKIGQDDYISPEEANEFLAAAGSSNAAKAAPTLTNMGDGVVAAVRNAVNQPVSAANVTPIPPVDFIENPMVWQDRVAPLMQQDEANKNTISSWYSTYNQPIDEAGLNYWAGQMASGRPDVFNAFRNELPSSLNIMRAHGGAVHDLAQKYKVGGAVRNFRFGGSDGELAQDDALAARRAREMLDDEGFEAYLRNQEFVGRPASKMRAAVSEPMTQSVPNVEMSDVRPLDVTASPAAQPVKLPPSATTPVSPAATDLMTMLANYSDDVYGPELKTARQKVSAENEKFAQMIETAMKGDSAVPDKTELYFRLAKAFGSPTKTGAFTENLSLVGGEAAEYAKDVRAAQRAEKQFRTQLGLEAQKLRAQGAREDLSTLRTLAGEELKDRRAILTEYLKSGRPQSEAGKAAIDAGLKQGTPEFTDFVNKYIDDKIRSGNIFKEAMVAIAGKQAETGKRRADIAEKQQKVAEEASGKLTPKEVDLKAKAEDAVLTIDNAMRDLSRAYDLNKNSFDTTLKDTATLTILEQTGSKDPKVLNTKELMNLLKSAMISSASQKLTGVLSDSDIKLLQSVAGIDSKSKEERAQVLKNAYRALQAGRAAQEKRLQEITRGLYRETAPATGEIE